MIYLIHYDRVAGRLVNISEFTDDEREVASKARLDLEIELLCGNGKYEVVLLEASSQDELKKTHRRYFDSFEEMKSDSKSE